MIEKYYADHREIFWSILIREKYGSPAIPTQGGFFLIRPSHPMKQSSDPITILIAKPIGSPDTSLLREFPSAAEPEERNQHMTIFLDHPPYLPPSSLSSSTSVTSTSISSCWHIAHPADSWKNQQKLAPTLVEPEIAKCHRLELFWQKYWLAARRNIGRGNGVKHIASEK